MPLRDHFRPPVDNITSWEALHGQWPGVIVQHLRTILPTGYTAAPQIHLGSQFEIDIATYERDDSPPSGGMNGGVATLAWAPPAPSVDVVTGMSDEDEYEVRIYDAQRGRRLVATIELVSPGNKDREEKRNSFIGKCAALLRRGVAVSIVDVVTVRPVNLYTELMRFIGHTDPAMSNNPPDLYAAACRLVERGEEKALQTWSRTLTIGEQLPTLPLWLSESLAVPLDLEVSYENACRDLWIT